MILSSNILPVVGPNPSFFESFEAMAQESDEIIIASGYLSVGSLVFLRENIVALPPTTMCIGMHYSEGFTRAQYGALSKLRESQLESAKGAVYICKAFPFHGKTYTFLKGGEPKAAIVGSSNISCIDPIRANSRVYEVDVLVNNQESLKHLSTLQKGLMTKAAIRFEDYHDPKIVENNRMMADALDVETLSRDEISSIWQKSTGLEFELPLKCTQKSNMNVFFGKGRLTTKTGLVRPRPWYEIEVIVSKSITEKHGYPRHSSFDVVTDDGYKFKVFTGGDYSKNLRSKQGLSTLGIWIKGRMENAGVLRPGEFIVPDMLLNYGRDSVTLMETSLANTWLLDFSVL